MPLKWCSPVWQLNNSWFSHLQQPPRHSPFYSYCRNLFCIESVPVNFGGCVPLLLFCSSTSYRSYRTAKQEGNEEPFILAHISGWWSNKHHGSVMNCTQQDLLWPNRLISSWLSTFRRVCVAGGTHRSLVNKSYRSWSGLSACVMMTTATSKWSWKFLKIVHHPWQFQRKVWWFSISPPRHYGSSLCS